MALRVEIVSRETIKPSSPTPKSRRIHRLSILDQVVLNLYVPVVLFYSDPSTTPEERSDRLKESLSKTLAQMYLIAGRVKDQYSIRGNDQGVRYIRARVLEDLSTVLKHPKIDLLGQLLPSYNAQAILSIQVTSFPCGGMTIGLGFRHAIFDESSIYTFVRNWASIARGDNINTDEVFFVDCTLMFPPQDVKMLHTWNKELFTKAIVTKRFVINASEIASLRENGTNASLTQPTRLEAVSTFIWAAVISATRHRKVKTHRLFTAVDLRERMDPPLPPHSVGNMVQMTGAQWDASEKTVDYKVLVERVRESRQLVSDDYVRKLHADGEYFKQFRQALEMTGESEEVFTLSTSSWCGFPLFGAAHFGWGKPTLIGIGMKLLNAAIIMDARDDEGIEAWVGLLKEDMGRLEQDSDFLAYVSSSQTL
ncbi:hypothetical protein RJ639_020740 [Escallonia herrerae]|uniref:Uncharacterized protein n=1 Tax=Escallonia herrerae TaxID=1293975 RepID=A0AA88V6V1_9ASTE|nr:hypothetical protein RJ639_020740 [Escallonia herrerae]